MQLAITKQIKSFDEPVTEGSTGTISFTVIDEETGESPKTTDLSRLVLTLYDERTLNIINQRKNQNAFNQNNVTYADGLLTYSVQKEDTACQADTSYGAVETHVAEFLFVYNLGKKQAKVDTLFKVIHLPTFT